jgi:hypothetical protein
MVIKPDPARGYKGIFRCNECNKLRSGIERLLRNDVEVDGWKELSKESRKEYFAKNHGLDLDLKKSLTEHIRWTTSSTTSCSVVANGAMVDEETIRAKYKKVEAGMLVLEHRVVSDSCLARIFGAQLRELCSPSGLGPSSNVLELSFESSAPLLCINPT